ncbi:hypothetical protein BCR44DRAFT_1449529 [Catenaria anguillulae PL171]|uniref:Uncharacterized protein n=1 Tax=Catenaria anguillulae PL171 TaxID=765915 RepID=A0A1Y2H4P2_9FUNG|nr:hypothetical protein BCR44DRAFT_1449529 [Catenaria anguillulae PL171]
MRIVSLSCLSDNIAQPILTKLAPVTSWPLPSTAKSHCAPCCLECSHLTSTASACRLSTFVFVSGICVFV